MNETIYPETTETCPDMETCPDAEARPDTAKPKRAYTTAEKLLLPIAALVAILWDRLVFNIPFITDSGVDTMMGAAIFWLCYLVLFHAFYWKKATKNVISPLIACGVAALCVWNLLFYARSDSRGANSAYGFLTYLVIPATLMAHAQFVARDLVAKEVLQTALAWLAGWILKPFSGLPKLFGAIGAALNTGNRSGGDDSGGEDNGGNTSGRGAVKKVAIGLAITLPLLVIILQLLSGADRVFKYYLTQILSDWSNSAAPWHFIVTLVAFALFYSFLWNIGFGANERSPYEFKYRADKIVCCVVLGGVSLAYAAFCAIQFTYLFARLGLPGGMTYSEYAREGFSQTVFVCAINLIMFGVTLSLSDERKGKSKTVKFFLATLLGFTGIMLISGFARLSLYIDAYGLTWLRVLSAWFVIYLAAVVVLCFVRLFVKKIPVVAVCALLLLFWYVALGYSTPDRIIDSYNSNHNQSYISTVETDALSRV